MGLTIALVDDHILIRNALSELLKRNNYIIVCEASNGKEFLDYLLQNNLPDIVLLDINMPVMDGFKTMQNISKKYIQHKVIVLSMFDNEQSIIKMIKLGAKGYLLKESQPAELINAIETVYKRGFYHSDLVNSKLLSNLNISNNPDQKKSNLMEYTPKEIELLGYFCTEMSYKEIGNIMRISARTVESQRDALFEKTETNTRIGLVVYAIKNEIIRL